MVTFVHSETMVNLVVFDANGRSEPRTSVPFYHGNDAFIPELHCGWMPYQAKQHEKNASA
jgi:hypothetical protein